MIEVKGEQFKTHKEYFQKYPWAISVNKRNNGLLLLTEYLKPCSDCKLSWHPASMTLDHVERNGYKTSNGKRKMPSGMLGYPTELFKKELALCEPVCQNCHTLREMKRDNHLIHKKWDVVQGKKFRGALEI